MSNDSGTINVMEMEVSPNLASEWLKKNKKNRLISQRLVNQYAADMDSGKWSLTHQSIAFHENGDLADGQHRLSAVIKAGKPVTMMVAFGIKGSAVMDIDSHRARSKADSIRIGEMSDWIGKDQIAAVRSFAPNKSLSTHQIVNMANSIDVSLIFATRHLRTKRRGITSSIVSAAIALAHMHGEDESLLARFCEVLISGVAASDADSSAIRLREWMIKGGATMHGQSQRNEAGLRTQRAIKAFVDRQPMKKLTLPSAEIYPVPSVILEQCR